MVSLFLGGALGETADPAALPVIFGSVTIMGMVSWWVVPEDRWLSRRAVNRVLDAAEGKLTDADDTPGTPASDIASAKRVHQE